MPQHTEYLKCDFTDAEMTDRARDLAAANRRRNAIEQNKKEIDSSLKSEIEAENSKIQRLSEQIGMGFEYRNIDCVVELDTPEVGKKRIVRIDTGEEVKVVAMTAEDKQASLDLQVFADADAAKAPIVTPPPVILQLNERGAGDAPSWSSVPTGEQQTQPDDIDEITRRQVGSHKSAIRRKRNPEAEAFADGSAEV